MVKTIQEIEAIIALRRNVNEETDSRFMALLHIDDRILQDREIFFQVSNMYFGPSFARYLTGYVFD